MTTHHWPPRPGISRAPMQQRSIVTDKHTEQTESNIRAEAYWSGFEAGRQHEATAQAKRQELVARAQALTDAHVKRCQGWDPAELRAQAQAQGDHEDPFHNRSDLGPAEQSLSHWGIHEAPLAAGWRRVTFDIMPWLLSDRGMGRPV